MYPQHVAMCVPASFGSEITYGIEVLQNTGSQPLTITSVTLAKSHGLAVVTAYLLDLGIHTTLSGVMPGQPAQAVDATWWSQQRPAVGGQVAAGTSAHLVLWLHTTGTPDPSFLHVDVVYSVGSNVYHWIGATSLSIKPNCTGFTEPTFP